MTDTNPTVTLSPAPSTPDDASRSSTPTLASPTRSTPRRVLAWALWDWGTQPFYTVITTFVFSVYITTASYFSSDPSNANGPALALSASTTVAGVLIAVIAPVLGQSADRSGHLVRNMRVLTWMLGLISMALFFVRPHPAYLVLGLILLALGSVVGEIAGSFYNASIDQVSTSGNVGRISGFGWGMGYIGGIVVLLVILALFIQPEAGLFGISDTPTKIRASMVVCGAWILIFTIPAMFVLKDHHPTGEPSPLEPTTERGHWIVELWRGDGRHRLGIKGSYQALFASIVALWRRDRSVAHFLLASALYRDGLAAVFSFGAVIAAQSFGFSTFEIIIFGAAANLIAGLVTIAFGLLDDRIGSKKVILICLGVLTAGCFAVFWLHQPGFAQPEQLCDPVTLACQPNPAYDPALVGQGKTIFWVFGLVLSCLCGPAQAASRSLLARTIPEGKSGEVFGLYTTTGRVISFVTPALFGVAVSLGAVITNQASTQHWGLIAIGVVLAAGFAVLMPLKVAKPQAR